MEFWDAITGFFANLSLESLIRDYGYWAILIGTFLEGETILVLGGIAAQQGFLELHLVMLAAFSGSYAGDQLAFTIGRRWGTKILARKPKWQARADYLLNKSPRFLNIWMVVFRFFYGLRNPTPWVLGSGGIGYRRFLILNGIGALVWAVAVAWGGYAFGALIEHIMGHMRWGALIVIIILVVAVALFIIMKHRRKRKNHILATLLANSPAKEETRENHNAQTLPAMEELIMSNETLAVLKTRRSIRKFQSRQVEDEKLKAVLEAGTYAPTGKNSQSPVIIAVQDKATITQLSKMNAAIMGSNSDPYYGAPTVLLIVADSSAATPVEDGCAVLTTLMTAAHALGLATCWINREQQMFASQEGKELLKKWGLKGDYIGVGACSLGYADTDLPKPGPRKEDYVVWVK